MNTQELAIRLVCPNRQCRDRFLADTDGEVVRGVCPNCGGEVIYLSKNKRREGLTIPPSINYVAIK